MSESPQQLPQGTATDAIADIMAYEKLYEPWTKRGEAILRRYRDERTDSTNARIVQRRFNILWSNVETLKPTLYARLPRAQVERRFKDPDPIGRVACEIAERCGNYLAETGPLNEVIKQAVFDRLLPGRAVAWVNYKADLTEVEQPINSDDDETGEEGEYEEPEGPEPELEKIFETVEPIYVDWRDFGHQPRRTWQEVWRAWRIIRMNRVQLVERFGEELGYKIPLDLKSRDDKKDTDSIEDQSCVYEVWDKRARKVCWVHKSIPDYLDETTPPVDLQEFWPFPRPLWATMTNDSLVPVPDYVLYQDQAAELDKITNRIGRLTDALKVAGVVDASVPELTRLLAPNGTPDNMLIQVPNWGKLVEKGGLAGAMQLVPLQEIAATLLNMYQARDQVLNVIYQVTGIADIIRGSSNPNETATAQSIKGQFASLRIKDVQAEVARFCRDVLRIMIEIAVEMYEPETIYEMVQAKQFCKPTPREQQMAQQMQQMGMQPPPPMEEFGQALSLLRNDKLRSFHVDIETDSTIAMNEQEDKQSAVEFVQAFGGFIQQFGQAVMAQPALAPVAGELLLYATRRFKAGRSMESSIEQAFGQIAQQASQPKPNPEMVKVENEAKQDQARLQLDQQKTQGELAIKSQGQQGEMALKQQRQQFDMQLEARRERVDNIVALRGGN